MTAPLLFLDTETTGLHPERDEVWEIAAVLRDGDLEIPLHLFVDHEPSLCAQLPEPFLSDHRDRYPIDCPTGERTGSIDHWWSRADAALELRDFVGDSRPHLVGAVPSFDDLRLGRMLRAAGGPFAREPWHYHVIDVEALAVGYLQGLWVSHEINDRAPQPPWDSEELSRAVGVDPEQFERHTAVGDVRWAMAIYDTVMGAKP